MIPQSFADCRSAHSVLPIKIEENQLKCLIFENETHSGQDIYQLLILYRTASRWLNGQQYSYNQQQPKTLNFKNHFFGGD